MYEAAAGAIKSNWDKLSISKDKWIGYGIPLVVNGSLFTYFESVCGMYAKLENNQNIIFFLNFRYTASENRSRSKDL